MPYWRLSSFYFSYFALLGAIIPYWTLYLSDRGYSAADIGVLGAILMGTKIVSPYILGWLADRTGRPMRVIRAAAFLSLLCFMGIFIRVPIEHDFYLMVVVVSCFSFFWNAVIGQFEAVTLAYIKPDFTRYGKIRAWGSIGFICAVISLGWVFNHLPIKQLPIFMAFLLLCIWLSSLLVHERSRVVRQSAAVDIANNLAGPTLTDILSRKSVIAFFTVCLLLQLSHGPYYTFYSLYLESYGYSKPAIGFLWGGSLLAELALFIAIAQLLNRFSRRSILMFSLFCCAIRWTLIGLYPNQLAVIIASQLLHAFTFASFHAVAVEWVRGAFGETHQGQGQALYSAISFGAGGALGAVMSGWYWDTSPQMVWFFAAAAGLMGWLILWRYFSDHPFINPK